MQKLPSTTEFERQPVPPERLKSLRSIIGMHAGEHVAGSEFMIGPLLLAAGVSAFDLLTGLAIGYLLAVLSWALVCTPIATVARLTLYRQLENICGSLGADERCRVVAEGGDTVTVSFWDKRAEKYNREISKHDTIYMQTIGRTGALLSRSDFVLDFGCASGEFSVDIAAGVQRVHGIDTSPRMIALASEKAQSRGVDNIMFDQADLFDQSLDENRYTGILAFSILHLVEDLRAVLRRVNELLPANGLLISETPCLGERGLLFKAFVGFAQRAKIAPTILNLTVAELEAEIAAAGFDITESKQWDPKNAVHWIVARKRQGSH